MWNGKNKALTFSFDDGVLQDIRAIEILDKYGLKATFNLNSCLLGNVRTLDQKGRPVVNHSKVQPKDVKEVYKNHEVAVHTKTHPNLTGLEDKEVINEVENDRQILSALCGYEVVGMAYPCGGVNNDDRVAKIIKEYTGVKYSRTITSVHNFDLQDNLYRFNPSIYYLEKDKMFDLAKKFIELKTDTPQIFYIWGHTYELDYNNPQFTSWQDFEEFCALVSGKDDIFYGTNKEILL
jgi:peptidoglycan/xylan/chitin deacetylase (PgdA/CDA1 family)